MLSALSRRHRTRPLDQHTFYWTTASWERRRYRQRSRSSRRLSVFSMPTPRTMASTRKQSAKGSSPISLPVVRYAKALWNVQGIFGIVV